MLKFNLKLNKAVENGGTGGGSKEAPPPPESKAAPTSQEEGSNLDDFGYEVAKAPDEPGKEGAGEKPKEEAAGAKPPAEESKLEGTTGYGAEPPKEEEPPKKEDPPVKIELGYELDLKDVDAKEALKLQQFAKDNALTKEAAQALVNLRKSEIAAAAEAQAEAQKQQQKAIANLKASWDKELRADPNFGGDKFAHNVVRAEKVLGEFMPETKKALTERKSMLPPYVMRDLAKLADHLYSTEKLVQGDATVADKEEKEESPLDFYQ